jgi:hypothetical protein
VKVEREHTGDPATARQIAIDHLRERPDYYKLLEKHVEKTATTLIKEEMEARARLRRARQHKTSAAYKLQDRIVFRGLDISIENAKGSTRKWHDPHGKETGSTYMHHAYGYIRGTKGTDGDHVDVYVGPDESAPDVFIVDQMKKPDFKEFDEQKIMLGFADAPAAKAAYMKQYNDPRFFGSIRKLPFEAFAAKVLDPEFHGEKVGMLAVPTEMQMKTARADVRRAALVAEQRLMGRGPTLLGGYPTRSKGAASVEDRLRRLEHGEQEGAQEKRVDGLAEHLDDAGLAMLAGPAVAKLTGEGLHALARHIPTTNRFGRAAHMVADGAHGVGEWLESPGAGRNLEHLSEIAGLALVSPTITKSIARRLAPEPVISPAPPTEMPESPESKIARVQPSFVDSALRMARAIVPGSQKTVAAAAHAVPSPAVSKVVAKIPHTYAAPSPQNFHPATVPGAPSPAKLQELPRGGNANWAPAQAAPAPAAALPPSARLATPPPGAAATPATAASAPAKPAGGATAPAPAANAPAAAPAAASPPAPVPAPATATPPVAAGAAAPAAGAGAPARGRILTPGRVLGAGAVGVGGLGLYGGYRAIDSMANIVDPQYAHQQGVSQEPVYPGRLY